MTQDTQEISDSSNANEVESRCGVGFARKVLNQNFQEVEETFGLEELIEPALARCADRPGFMTNIRDYCVDDSGSVKKHGRRCRRKEGVPGKRVWCLRGEIDEGVDDWFMDRDRVEQEPHSSDDGRCVLRYKLMIVKLLEVRAVGG